MGYTGSENKFVNSKYLAEQLSALKTNINADKATKTEVQDISTSVDALKSETNDGNVKKADEAITATTAETSVEAEKISGVDEAQPLQYYGKNSLGEVGYHFFPIDTNAVFNGVEVRTLENMLADNTYVFESTFDLNGIGTIIQAYKEIEGSQDVISVLNTFDTDNISQLYCNSSSLSSSSTSIYINKKYNLSVSLVGDNYESEIINKDDFAEILSMEV